MSVYSCQFLTVYIYSCQHLIVSVHSCQYLYISLPSTQVILPLKYYCHCDVADSQVLLALQYPWHSCVTGTPTPLLFLCHLTLRRPWYSCTSDTCQCDTLTVRRLAPRRTTKRTQQREGGNQYHQRTHGIWSGMLLQEQNCKLTGRSQSIGTTQIAFTTEGCIEYQTQWQDSWHYSCSKTLMINH